MPTYAVQFYTAEGRYLRRTIDADTVEAAKAALRREGHHPVSARPAKRNSRLLKVRLTTRQQVELFEQLELHLGSGVEAASALDEIRQSASHKSVRTVADVMYRSLATAKLPISDCFAMFPRSFPPSIISEIKAGEVGGRPALAKTCATLRVRIEYDEQTRAEFKRGISYPAVLCVAALGLVVLMLTYFVPRVAALLRELNAPMPLSTVRVIAAAQFAMDHWLWLFVFAFVPLAIRSARRVPRFALAIDNAFLWTPIFGRIYLYLATARFAHYYGELKAAGSQQDSILRLCETLSGNLAWQAAVIRIREKVTDTAKLQLWEACDQESYFPRQAVSLIKTGEQNGRLETVFRSIAKYYGTSAKNSIDSMLRWLTPVVTVFVAVFVFGVLGALFAPLFTVLLSIG